MNNRRNRRALFAAGIAIAAVVPIAACASGADDDSDPAAEGNGTTGSDPGSFTVMTANENPTLRDQLDALAADQCRAENEALPIEHRTIAQSEAVQQITLLASQDALPAHFIAGTAQVRPDGDLGTAELVLDYEQALTTAGAWDNVLPAAASTVKNVYGHMVSLPYQYNLEGIWYNTAIFDELGLSEPQTFDELLATSQTLVDAGYQPFAMPGAAGWPLTRLMGMYIHRNVGLDAMAAIRDGEAQLTDPDYVEGAQALADMADAGFFGEGFISTEPDAATAAFLTGQAAMKYDGTWLLSNINNSEQNEVGADNIGFMPFPGVNGGAGSIDHWPANAGSAMAMNPSTYGPAVGDWLACIAENYGAQALSDAGVLSGFAVNQDVTDVPDTTAAVQERMASIEETVLWFEALFDSQSNSLAQSNVSLLATGQMSAEQYMTDLQSSIDSNR